MNMNTTSRPVMLSFVNYKHGQHRYSIVSFIPPFPPLSGSYRCTGLMMVSPFGLML